MDPQRVTPKCASLALETVINEQLRINNECKKINVARALEEAIFTHNKADCSSAPFIGEGLPSG